MSQISDPSSITLVAFDVHGVFTDGRFLMGPQEEEYQTFHTRDGHGIKGVLAPGRQVAIISDRNSQAAELGGERIVQSCKDKQAASTALLDRRAISRQNVVFMGDDLPDLEVMRSARLPVTVLDGAPEIRAVARIVTRAPGGHGAIREFCDLLPGNTEHQACGT